jgi:tetratricopeptide (TPR) repeat protein
MCRTAEARAYHAAVWGRNQNGCVTAVACWGVSARSRAGQFEAVGWLDIEIQGQYRIDAEFEGEMSRFRNPAKNRSIWLTAGIAGAILAPLGFGQASANDAGGVVERAHQLAVAHHFEQANELLTDYAYQHPTDTSVLVELGKVQLAQGLNEDAMKSFETVLAIEPKASDARDGEVQAAIAAALANRKSGLQDSALMDLLRAEKLVDDSPQLLLDAGIQEENMRIFRDADTALTKAHELAPQDLKILYALAHVELDEQKMPDAEANLKAYLKAQPGDATAHYGLGKLLHMELKNDDATEELERSIALEPKQSASYYELGEMALEQERNDEAKTQFEKVLSLAPHHGGALTGMGIVAYRARDYQAAEGFLKDAVMDAPDYPAAHHYYSLVLARLGRKDEASHEAALATSLDEEQTKTRHGNILTEIH